MFPFCLTTESLFENYFYRALSVGAGESTKIHSVNDAAPWIAGQAERVFGLQGNYLIDFYHLCEFLGAAAELITPDDKKNWLAEQKKESKEAKISEVLNTIEPHIELDFYIIWLIITKSI